MLYIIVQASHERVGFGATFGSQLAFSEAPSRNLPMELIEKISAYITSIFCPSGTFRTENDRCEDIAD